MLNFFFKKLSESLNQPELLFGTVWFDSTFEKC